MKKCSTCKIEKSLDYFGKSKRTSDGLRGQCRGCVALSSAIYRRNNPEKIKASRIASLLAVDHDHATKQVRALLCQICNTCGRPDDIELLLLRIAYLRRFSKP
jgi:hypothetical protein